MFTLSFGKDNRFLTSVSVRLRYLWSSIKAVPRQLTLRCRLLNLPFSCDKLQLFLASCSASCCVSQHGSLPRNEEFLAVVNAAWNAHGYFSKYYRVDWKSSLEEFQKNMLLGLTQGKLAEPVVVGPVPLVAEVSGWSCGCCTLFQGAAGDAQHGWHSLCSRQPLPGPRD